MNTWSQDFPIFWKTKVGDATCETFEDIDLTCGKCSNNARVNRS